MPLACPRQSIVFKKLLRSSSQSRGTLSCVITCYTSAANRNPGGVFTYEPFTVETAGVR